MLGAGPRDQTPLALSVVGLRASFLWGMLPLPGGSCELVAEVGRATLGVVVPPLRRGAASVGTLLHSAAVYLVTACCPAAWRQLRRAASWCRPRWVQQARRVSSAAGRKATQVRSWTRAQREARTSMAGVVGAAPASAVGALGRFLVTQARAEGEWRGGPN